MKNKVYLKIVAVVCFIVIFTISVLMLLSKGSFSEEDFSLSVDLDKTAFNVGEKIFFKATIINKSGKDVNMSSNGEQPCVFFNNINNNITHVETCLLVQQIFKANERITRVFEYEANETGTYLLDAHYQITVDNIAIKNKIDDIIIEVK